MSTVKFNTTLVGFDTFMREMRQAFDNFDEDCAQVARLELDEVIEEIKRVWVPIDTGELRDSIYVTGPTKNGRGFDLDIGAAAPHALIQHEDLTFHHDHGQAKYIEEPLMIWLAGLE